MKSGQTKLSWVGLVGLLVVLFVIALIGLQSKKGPLLPTSTYAPAIPESNQVSKDFIDRASAKAEAGDFRGAVTILDQAIADSPDDQNLKLTKEYYENEAVRHGQ